MARTGSQPAARAQHVPQKTRPDPALMAGWMEVSVNKAIISNVAYLGHNLKHSVCVMQTTVLT